MLTITEAKKADISKIGGLYAANWQKSYAGLLPASYLRRINDRYATEKWGAYLELAGHGILLAESDGAFLGFAAYMPVGAEPYRVFDVDYDGTAAQSLKLLWLPESLSAF